MQASPKMEVDRVSSQMDNIVASGQCADGDVCNLKRSSSMPQINVLVSCTETNKVPAVRSSMCAIASISQTFMSPTLQREKSSTRIRRFSTSSMHSPTTPVKTASRLVQLRQDELLPHHERDEVREREMHTARQLSSSLEELSVTIATGHSPPEEAMITENLTPRRPKSYQEPLHIFTSPLPPYGYPSSSPSPTRVGKKQVTNATLTPSPSPSPTRKTFARRSLSPAAMVAIRPSTLSGALKRKLDCDVQERMDTFVSPAKKINSNTLLPGTLPGLHAGAFTSSLACSLPASPGQQWYLPTRQAASHSSVADGSVDAKISHSLSQSVLSGSVGSLNLSASASSPPDNCSTQEESVTSDEVRDDSLTSEDNAVVTSNGNCSQGFTVRDADPHGKFCFQPVPEESKLEEHMSAK